MKSIVVLTFLLSLHSYSQSDSNSEMDSNAESDSKVANPDKKQSEILNFIQNNTDIKKPMSLRNPFEVMLVKKKKASGKKTKKSLGGEELIGKIDVNDLLITGVLMGKHKRAFAKVGTDVVILKEGMKIGPTDRIVLKAILPGGVVLVEKYINVYGQEEYLETIIPLGEREQKE